MFQRALKVISCCSSDESRVTIVWRKMSRPLSAQEQKTEEMFHTKKFQRADSLVKWMNVHTSFLSEGQKSTGSLFHGAGGRRQGAPNPFHPNAFIFWANKKRIMPL